MKNSLTIDIQRQSSLWKKQLFLSKPMLKKIVFIVLKAIKVENQPFSRFWEVSVLLTDNVRMQHLNATYRGKDKPTNVLAFPLYSPKELKKLSSSLPSLALGDIVLAYETIDQEAQEQHKKFTHHLFHLIIHGILHLYGYDHQKKKQTQEMESLEIQILAEFGISNPYKNMI